MEFLFHTMYFTQIIGNSHILQGRGCGSPFYLWGNWGLGRQGKLPKLHKPSVAKPGLEAWPYGSALSCPQPLSLSHSSVVQNTTVSFPRAEATSGRVVGVILKEEHHFSFLAFFLTRAWSQDSRSQISAKVPNQVAQWQTWGEWAMACDSEGVSGEEKDRSHTKKVHGSWDAMEPSRSGPMHYHQFIASPAVFLETQNGLCVLNYNPTYREFISSKSDAWCTS